MKSILTSMLLVFLLGQSSLTFGQAPNSDSTLAATQASTIASSSANAPIEAETETFQVEGIVTERRKYSFTVEQDGHEYEVKLAPNTAIGLRMNKPWFDWEKGLVVVDSTAIAGEKQADAASDSTTTVRKAIPLPAEKLFVISRFREQEQLDFFLKTDDKRINFYLVTPFDPGQHMPTSESPYISGALSVEADQSLRLNVEGKTIPVRLGFRNATMNGFSISQLVPEETRVLLSGVGSKSHKQITARSIVFEPIHQHQADSDQSPFSAK